MEKIITKQPIHHVYSKIVGEKEIAKFKSLNGVIYETEQLCIRADEKYLRIKDLNKNVKYKEFYIFGEEYSVLYVNNIEELKNYHKQKYNDIMYDIDKTFKGGWVVEKYFYNDNTQDNVWYSNLDDELIEIDNLIKHIKED